MLLDDYLRLLHRRWLVVAIMPLLGLVVASGLTLTQPPEYASTAESFVTAGGGTSVADLSQGTTFTQEAVRGYARIATTEYILAPVIASLGLDVEPEALAKRVTATADPDTSVLEITAQDSSATRAALIANAVTDRLAAAVPELTPGSGQDTPLQINRVQSAAVSATPQTPNVLLNLVIGLLTGLVLGVALAFARESLDTRLHNSREVEQFADVALLGAVLQDPETALRPLVVVADERSAQAENFRTLRTNLRFLPFRSPSRSLVLTSALQGEGKSTTVANLALAVALIEDDVVVVDADLRQPQLHELFGIDSKVGLVDVLIGAATLDEVLQSRGSSGLRVLPAGRVPPNPSELLQSDAMSSLVAELRARFTTVLFDAPPLLPVADAAILAKLADGAIVVAAVRRVRRAQLRQALHILHRADVRVFGTVATMVPRKGTDAYSYVLDEHGGSTRLTLPSRFARRRPAARDS